MKENWGKSKGAALTLFVAVWLFLLTIFEAYGVTIPPEKRGIWVQYKKPRHLITPKRESPATSGVYLSLSDDSYTAALDTCRLRTQYCGGCLLGQNGLTRKSILARLWSNQAILAWTANLGLTQQDRSETLEIVPDGCLPDKSLMVWDGMIYKRFEPIEIPPEKADIKGVPARFVTFHFVFAYHVDVDSISIISSEQVDPFAAGGRPGPDLDADGEYVYYRNHARAYFRSKLSTGTIEPLSQIRAGSRLLVPLNIDLLIVNDTASSSLTLMNQELDTLAYVQADLGPWTRDAIALDSTTFVISATAPIGLSTLWHPEGSMGVYLVDFLGKRVHKLFDAEPHELIDADWADRREPPVEVDPDTLK